MKPDSALELQVEVFTSVFGFVEAPIVEGEDRSAPSHYRDPHTLDETRPRAQSAKRRHVEDIALGVTMDNSEARLAVLVQDRRKLKCTMIDEILDRAQGEAEVLYIGRQRPLWTTARNDPLRLGCSISPVNVEYAGTLGCFCRDNATGRDAILSNNHVLGDVNQTEPETGIMQPGARDSGMPGEDDIASFARFVPIRFGGVPNKVDAALAFMLEGRRAANCHTLYGSDEPPEPAMTFDPSTLGEALPGMTVFKTGRTTRFTRGRVRAVNVNNYLVDMGNGLARFDGQIAVEMAIEPASPFSRPGDSGSLVVDENGRAVGLLFAGSASGGAGNLGITGLNPISSVVEELGVTLL